MTLSLGLINLLGWLTKLRKQCTHWIPSLLQRKLKDTNEQPEEEMQRVKS